MLEIRNLVKEYKAKGGTTVRALDGVSLQFGETGDKVRRSRKRKIYGCRVPLPFRYRPAAQCRGQLQRRCG